MLLVHTLGNAMKAMFVLLAQLAARSLRNWP